MSLNIKQYLGQGKVPLGLLAGKSIDHIELKVGKPAVIHLNDGDAIAPTCLHCPDQPCYKYPISETSSSLASKFKVDNSLNTCANGAIKWNFDNSHPEIEAESCVLCGVCVSRCPSKAIHLTPLGAVLSQDEVSPVFFPENPEKTFSHKATNEMLNQSNLKGAWMVEDVAIATEALDRLKNFSGKASTLLPNILFRNLLRALNIEAESYAQGVQYSSVDILFRIGERYGAAEVELGNAAIDVPRNLAGDVAVLAARYEMPKDLETLSLVNRLPQGREQYWMVIDDMEKVLGLKIRTLTILCLYLLVWNNKKLVLQNDLFLASEIHLIGLRESMESLLSRKINLPIGFENQFEPSKLVE